MESSEQFYMRQVKCEQRIVGCMRQALMKTGLDFDTSMQPELISVFLDFTKIIAAKWAFAHVTN